MSKNKLILLATALAFANSSAVFASTSQNNNHNKQDDAAISAASVKNHKVTKKSSKHSARGNKASSKASSGALNSRVSTLESQVASMQKDMEFSKSGIAWSKLYSYGPAVVTTPIIGEPNYSGYDLLVNIHSVREDINLIHSIQNESGALLKWREEVADYYTSHNLKLPQRPIVVLSGDIEGQIFDSGSFNTKSRSDIDLAGLSIVGAIEANDWITGFFKIKYSDNSSPDERRVDNSRLFIDRGYVTVGNTNKFPIYGTIGQINVPFGIYYNWMVSSPLTDTLGKTKERTLIIGFNNTGLYGSIYAFKGDSHTSDARNINNWGGNLGYSAAASNDKWNFDFGGGMIANLADSGGMQMTGLPDGQFEGFSHHERIFKDVPAADVYGKFSIAPFDFSAEYLGAVSRFDKRDLTFNGNGAMPRAMDVEGDYNFHAFSKPSFLSAGFGRTWEALAVNLPKYSYFASIGTSIFRNTVQSFEYRHDINYDKHDTATGTELPIIVGSKHRDVFTFSFHLFF